MTNAAGRGLNSADYEEIEAAVLETARGRWFLAEHARRTQASGLDDIHAILSRLDSKIAAPAPVAKPEHGLQSRLVLSRLVEIAEGLRDLSWRLRETGQDEGACEVLDSEIRALLHLGTMLSTPKADAHEAAPVEAPVAAPLGVTHEAPVVAPAAKPADLSALGRFDAMPVREQLAAFR